MGSVADVGWDWLRELSALLAFALLVLVFLAIVCGPPGALLRFLSGLHSGRGRPRISEEARRAAREVANKMKQLARPTLLLIPSQQAVFSKLGGSPELPEELEWPGGETGPTVFLGQIDLAALGAPQPIDWLPARGRLYFFCELERLDCPDAVHVIYSRSDPGPPRPAGAGSPFRERRVGFVSYTSLPSTDWLNVDEQMLSNDPLDWAAAQDLSDAPPPDDLQHRVGGYPNEIQMECMPLSCEHLARGLPEPKFLAEVPPAVERASKQWRLLMQIDSDPALKMTWGDAGRLYIFIRERDAQAGDFSKTVTLSQTH